MSDGHKWRRFWERGLLRFFRIAIAAIALLSSVWWSVAGHAAAAQHSGETVVQGTVRDAAGKAVAGASVIAVEARTPSKQDVTKTDADGGFSFPALPAGSYTFLAEQAGERSRSVTGVSLVEGDRKQIQLVLGAADQMSFSDAPDFTVAGVTDWTAVGGHGSDSILRTSEELARETAPIPAPSARPSQIGRASCRERV